MRNNDLKNIQGHLDKNNLHHAYLIEGEREQVVSEIFAFIESMGISTMGNADVSHMAFDAFKIDDARSLKSYALERSFSPARKIFIISANNFLLEAQNSLLKVFEDPIENTHFFVIISDVNMLLPTLLSRFYLISARQDLAERGSDLKEAEAFIKMPARLRLEFIKDLLTEEESEEEDIIQIHSARSRAIHFLNTLELALHRTFVKNFSGLTLPGVPGGSYAAQNFLLPCFAHFFKVREVLRQSGSATKTLMESVALMIPEKI